MTLARPDRPDDPLDQTVARCVWWEAVFVVGRGDDGELYPSVGTTAAAATRSPSRSETERRPTNRRSTCRWRRRPSARFCYVPTVVKPITPSSERIGSSADSAAEEQVSGSLSSTGRPRGERRCSRPHPVGASRASLLPVPASDHSHSGQFECQWSSDGPVARRRFLSIPDSDGRPSRRPASATGPPTASTAAIPFVIHP